MKNKIWYKENEDDEIWWLYNQDEVIGEFVFSFDKKKEYNMFADYPHNMTEKEVEIFNKENPYWANFFRDRRK